MSNRDPHREVPTSDEDFAGSERVEPDVTGRALTVEAGPEDRLMQLPTIETRETANPENGRPSDDVDDRAANAARTDVRRHEHSAD